MKTFVLLAALVGIGSQITLEPSSKVWVKGDSTVRAFTCNATEFASQLLTSGDTDVATLVTEGTVTIPVGKLDCGNAKMNEHMVKALKTGTIEFKLNSYSVNGTSAVLLGALKIAGTTKDIEIPGTVTQEGNLVRVKATKEIVMSQWGVKPPSLMMGTMKVKDAVTVGFDVTLKP